MNREFLRFLFKVGSALALGALAYFLASFAIPHPWSKYLGMFVGIAFGVIVGIAFGVIKAGDVFDRLWPEPKKGWAE